MTKAQILLETIKEQDDHLHSSGLDGYNKNRAKGKVNKILFDSAKGIFSDDTWAAVHNVWDALRGEGIEPIIINAKYDNSAPPKAKTWTFNIYFKNDKGNKTTLFGILTASGAGSVEDPLDRYDVVAYVS